MNGPDPVPAEPGTLCGRGSPTVTPISAVTARPLLACWARGIASGSR